MSVVGTWRLTITTPIGKHASVLELTETDGGVEGSAKGDAESTPPIAPVFVDGNRLTWAQAITKPMRLNLTFAVTGEGDTLTGTAKAGGCPPPDVMGVRVA